VASKLDPACKAVALDCLLGFGAPALVLADDD